MSRFIGEILLLKRKKKKYENFNLNNKIHKYSAKYFFLEILEKSSNEKIIFSGKTKIFRET